MKLEGAEATGRRPAGEQERRRGQGGTGVAWAGQVGRGKRAFAGGLRKQTWAKNSPASAGDTRDGFNPCGAKTPWRRKWQPTPGLLPGAAHGQRSLVGCKPWGRAESDMAEQLGAHTWPWG